MQKFVLLFLCFQLFFTKNENEDDFGTLTMGLSYFNQSITDIKECLFETRNIFILRTSNGEIFTSENFGFDWMKLEFENELEFIQIKQNDLLQNQLIGITNKNIFITTENCFIDYDIRQIENVHKINSIQFNEFKQNALLIEATKVSFERQQDEIIKSKNRQLFYSANFGQKIELIQQNIKQALWSNDQKYPQRIVCILKNPFDITQDDNLWEETTKLVITDDFFETSKLIEQSINKLIKTKNYFYVSKIINKDQQKIKLHLLNNYEQQITQINLPQNLDDYSYTIQNENQKEIFIHVTHGQNQRFGNLYLSENGIDFFMVQENVIKDSYGFIDLVKMKWSSGTFITNRQIDNQRQTLITHNFGINWIQLSAENPIHFHQQSSEYFTSLFSDESIPGLIIGNGNQGDGLQDNLKDINTYISLDFGKNFKKIQNFPSMFQSSKDGNFLILIQENEPTTTMSFSVDQGHTFKTIQILEDTFQVLDIKRSNYDSFQFMINGIQVVRDQKYGITIPIDFRKLIQKECEEEQLYEVNSPCMLGHKKRTIRKKVTSTCLQNNKQFEKFEQCECSEKDHINGHFFEINKCFLKKVEQEIINKLPLGIFDLTMITLFTLVLFLYKNKVRKIWKKRNYKFFEINDKIKINQYQSYLNQQQ